jgi:hypothetical protein
MEKEVMENFIETIKDSAYKKPVRRFVVRTHSEKGSQNREKVIYDTQTKETLLIEHICDILNLNHTRIYM